MARNNVIVAQYCLNVVGGDYNYMQLQIAMLRLRLSLRLYQLHNLCGAGESAFIALQAVWVQIAGLVATTVIGRQLHWTYTGAALALHLTGAINMNAGKRSG